MWPSPTPADAACRLKFPAVSVGIHRQHGALIRLGFLAKAFAGVCMCPAAASVRVAARSGRLAAGSGGACHLGGCRRYLSCGLRCSTHCARISGTGALPTDNRGTDSCIERCRFGRNCGRAWLSRSRLIRGAARREAGAQYSPQQSLSHHGPEHASGVARGHIVSYAPKDKERQCSARNAPSHCKVLPRMGAR
jgi:hypothetical protein